MNAPGDLLPESRPRTTSPLWWFLAGAGLLAIARFALVALATTGQPTGPPELSWAFVVISAAVVVGCMAMIRTHTRAVAIVSLVFLPVAGIAWIVGYIVWGLSTSTYTMTF
jgi:hypothetical protein